jgi:regulator of sigma E protease
MVMIHEFGHYCAGKLLHFKINEFSIGFGKSLFSHKSKKTGEVFSLRLIPLGGYCAFEGEENGSEVEGAFNKQAPWKRLIVLFSGAFFNILSGIIFSIILLCATGYDIPKIYSVESVAVVTQTTLKEDDKLVSIDGVLTGDYGVQDITVFIKNSVDDGTLTQKDTYEVIYYRNNDYYSETIEVSFESNAETLKKGDVVLKVNGTSIDFTKDNAFSSLIQSSTGDTATLTIKRDGATFDVEVNLFNYGIDDSAKVIGIKSEAYKFTFGESLARCVPFTFGLAYKVLECLWQLITGQIGLNAVGGPITTITTIATYTQNNFASFFILLPLIAVNLGVFNLLPIPALDGSKMVFTLIEWIRGKPINPKVENAIHNIGFIVLMALVLIADLYHLLFA